VYLKNLTIHGFKSFANRTTLEFPSSLIGIVGPNGSGKSNICDSIRWVLGEQSSKALRGQKMDDVIFGGTSTAQQAKHAEVKLTFDNKSRFFKIDSDDFVIVRKIFRTGDSEYIINNEQCRLKDIKERIMDTGLGRDAYSIIGQGTVDNIISSRGNERRTIIEEAAGIVKYKADKTESLRKIADTQSNIDRVSDLIVELDKQLMPLSIQAQTAQRYMMLDEQLKNKKKKKMVYEYDRLGLDLSRNRGTVDEYHRKREEHNQKITIFTAEIEAMRAKIVTLNDKNALIKKDNYDVLVEHESLQNVEKELLKKITEINTNRESYVRTVDEVIEKIEKFEAADAEIEAEIKSTEQYVSGLEIEIKKNTEDIGTLSLKVKSGENQVSASQDTTIETINQLSAAKNRLNSHESELKFAAQQAKKISFDILKAEERAVELKSKTARGTSEQKTNREKHEKLKSRVRELNEKISAVSASEKQLLKTIQDVTGELLTVKAQHAAQEQVKRNFDGFKYGVKFIMQSRQQQPNNFKGVQGIVSDLISVIPEYETAIEVALGAQMQSIVVEKAKDTEYCIDLLKRNKAGRVTFLPLDTVRSGGITVIPSNLKGFIGIASELVKFDEKYKSIFEYLLNSVMIVDTIEHANEFASRNRFSGRIVTLGGELITSSGTITGGSLDKNASSSHFSNSENISMLKSRIVYLDDKLKQDHIKLDGVKKQLETLGVEYDAARTEITRLSAFLETGEGSGEDFARELTNLEAELAAMSGERKNHETRVKELDVLMAQERKVISAFEEKLKAFNESVQKTKSNYSEDRVELERLSRLLTDQQVEQASITQKLNGLRKKIIENQNEIASLQKRTKADQGALSKFEEQYAQQSVKLEEVQKKLDEIKAKTGNIKAEEEEISRELDNLNNQIRIKENLIASRARQAGEMLTKVHEIELACAGIETNIKNTLNLLETEYKLRADEFVQYRDEAFKYDEVGDEINDLQQSIDRLGLVNMSAIEEYKSLSERVNELKMQRDDLVSARDAIYKIVEKTDAECTRLFNDTFNKINDYIGEIFQLLFNGGSARLFLEDESKPLESNIDIKAQPPGKKLQSITLMSGGEKALTALSLLFAILKVKPSPFCILDEVEASLDEFNVLRFVKMLNNFKEKTQFLIITHNKQTMQHLDLLYGVTMEEKGISKIISVRLEEAYDIVDMSAGAQATQKNVA